jgi:hypothetical protein
MLYKIFQNSHCHKVYTTYCVDFDCLFKSCQYKERRDSVNIIEFDHYQKTMTGLESPRIHTLEFIKKHTLWMPLDLLNINSSIWH